MSPFVFACSAAILLGCIVRARPVLLADFPLNDGGLFYQMTEELQHANYRLPSYTEYNGVGIPFAYPPLAFYAAGFLADAGSVDLAQVVRLLPLVTACATLVAFLLLARSMLSRHIAIVAAVTAFALMPRSFTWLIMGGGLTRAFGFLFTILALHQAHLLFTRRQLKFAVSAGLFAGLTPLSHLGTVPFLAASLALFFIAYGRHREGLIGAVIIGALTLALSAPWWVTIVREHGLAPFHAAGQTGPSVFSSGAARRTVLGHLARFGGLSMGEPLFPVLGVLAVAGALVSLRNRAFPIPAWWVMTFIIDVRAGETYATIPAALLAGIGVHDVLLPLLARRQGTPHAEAVQSVDGGSYHGADPLTSWSYLSRHWFSAAVVGFLVAYCSLAALARDADFGTDAAYLTSLSRDERDAMSWVALHTAPTSRFFVVPEAAWQADKVAEWFPVLARRASVATVQGREWIDDGGFDRYTELYKTARQCAGRDTRCVDEWSSAAGTTFSHVFVPKAPNWECCRLLRTTLRSDPRYRLVFDGAGAEVFAREWDGDARTAP
ncbi:MAG TPA: hypothetical protein VM076_19905 [Gemmatimonadaceae bacterium]|nr:hypothetical protein [Gemmatimonadaceae bacterium]